MNFTLGHLEEKFAWRTVPEICGAMPLVYWNDGILFHGGPSEIMGSGLFVTKMWAHHANLVLCGQCYHPILLNDAGGIKDIAHE